MLRDLDLTFSTYGYIILSKFSVTKASGNLSLTIHCHLFLDKKSPKRKHI